ncbi:hypothetical protein DL764_004417 [Monosporascus ibericus]|uniref:Uncharacterized protein n=1 Tax=Monosporascus ibericus TaxID=155417 RepID=A0A4Q4TD54_9PEZI|nr:hypothetical protein DL764_004417 [Monosporascus ibericus]
MAAHLGLEDMMLRLLCEQGLCPDGKPLPYEDQPPLHYAIISAHPGCVSVLLAHGADLSKTGSEDETPLECPLQHGHEDVAAILFEAGATATNRRTADSIARRGALTGARLLSHVQSLNALTSSLLKIARWKHVPLLREYFDTVAPLVCSRYNQQETSCPLTALVKRLLQSKFAVSTRRSDIASREAVEVALKEHEHFVDVFFLVSISHSEVLRDLLTSHPELKTQADNALPGCINRRLDGEIVACLSRAGYSLPPPQDPSSIDTRKWRSLHAACEAGSTQQVRDLVKRDDVDIDARGLRDRTALHVAAQNGHLEVVKILIQHGADLDARTCFKSTADNLPTQRGYHRIAALVREARDAERGRHQQ